MSSTSDLKLRERVKELKCLYAVTRFALEADNDVDALLHETARLLPEAMQFPELAEVSITTSKFSHETPGFAKCRTYISSHLEAKGKGPHLVGTIKVGYKAPGKKTGHQVTKKSATKGSVKDKIPTAPAFLQEEKNLLKAIAREVSLFIHKAHIAESNKKLQLQLQHSDRLAFVGELSAGIAHELNEPLGRILGFAQLIQKNGGLTGQPADDIERIIKASLYTREIIKKLMLFSRQMPRQVISVNLNAIISNILYFIDVRFQDRGVEVVRKLDANLPEIQADPVQLSQVLVNLITNAVHAMPNGGTIRVITKKSDEYVKLTIADTGHGMTPEVRKKIFEPFFTTKPVGQGTGLGLSVVQGIIEDHEGKIAVTSAVGKGTRFEIQLRIKE
ncbi:ATP-binding protein [Chryseolinea sp. T2]|uniref:sensor histidine kinase n=1 Tax=Chryseolinea sp. T2 TaxID=3129255 RepID=UPI0030782083